MQFIFDGLVHKTVEVPQSLLAGVVDVPFVVQCVDKLVDVPVVQVLFLDMVVTLVVGQRQVRRRLSMSLLLPFIDKARTSL